MVEIECGQFGDGVEPGWRLERVDVQSGHLHIALTREAFCFGQRGNYCITVEYLSSIQR